MKNLILIFLFFISCLQNTISIQELYIKTENLSEETKQTFKYKKIEKCHTRNLLFGLGGEFNAKDYYDKEVVALINEAFRVSNQNPWYDVEIYRDSESCVSLTGYYNEK